MKLIIEIPDDAYSMIMETTFTENYDVAFRQSAEDRRKTLQIFATLDAIRQGKPLETYCRFCKGREIPDPCLDGNEIKQMFLDNVQTIKKGE